jgi:hypothetical protein
MDDATDKLKAIYDQDCHFYRYQDQKKWDRFRTAAIVEGAVYYALYGQMSVGLLEKRIAIVFGFLMLTIILLICLKDQADADHFLDRIRQFEQRSHHGSKGSIRWGRHLMVAAILLLLLAHVVIGFTKWSETQTDKTQESPARLIEKCCPSPPAAKP